jgi:hypothetical protein
VRVRSTPMVRRATPVPPRRAPARVHRAPPRPVVHVKRHRAHPATTLQRVRDVVPLRVDVAAGLGELQHVERADTTAAALALLVAALAAASGAGVVLATRELR